MHLTKPEVERFYHLWFPLLHYVNQQRNLVPSFPQAWHEAQVAPEVVLPLRGYGVLGLTSSIEETIGPYLPIYVQAVLIPFEDRIIYDSLLSSYPIVFGGGYRRSLKDTYRNIQERGGIITRLPPGDEASGLARVDVSNRKVLTAFQKALGISGLSPKMIQEHMGNLTAFADEFLNQQAPPRLLLDLTQREIESYQVQQKGNFNFVSFKRFVRFLRDTERMDRDEADRLLQFFRGK